MKYNDDATLLKHFMEKDGIYTFLAGLNIEFDPVQVQVLGKEEVPSLNETIVIICGGQRGVMMESQSTDNSTLVTKDANPKAIK